MQPGRSLVILKTACVRSAKSTCLTWEQQKQLQKSLQRYTTCWLRVLQMPHSFAFGLIHRIGHLGWNHKLQRWQAKPRRKQDLLRKAGGEIQPDSLRFPTGPGSRRSSAVYIDTDAAFSPGEFPWAKTYCLGLRFGPQPCQCHKALWYWR